MPRIVTAVASGMTPVYDTGITALPPAGLLTPGDLRYLGVVRVPQDSVGTPIFGGGAPYNACCALRRVGGQIRLFLCSRLDYAVAGQGVWELKPPGGAAEFTPAGAWDTLGPAPVAEVQTAWDDVYWTTGVVPAPANGFGRRLLGRTEINPIVMGLWWDETGQRLFWSYKDPYSTAPFGNSPSLGFTTLDNPTTGAHTAFGPWRCANGSQACHAFMTDIPATFAAAHTPGKRMAIGSPWNSGDVASYGAMLYASTLPTATTPTNTAAGTDVGVPQTTLIEHGEAHRLARPADAGPARICLFDPYGFPPIQPTSVSTEPAEIRTPAVNTGQPTFGPTSPNGLGITKDEFSTAAWIETASKRGIVFVGSLAAFVSGSPNYTYGVPANLAAHDPTAVHVGYAQPGELVPPYCPHGQVAYNWGATGPFASTLVPYLAIFDPEDVPASLAQPWLPQPRSFVRLSTIARATGGLTPMSTDGARDHIFGGMAWDAVSTRLYLTEMERDVVAGQYQPIIHVFSVVA